MKEEPGRVSPLKHRLFGIRAQESYRRKAKGCVSYNERYKLWEYKPIFEWLDWEVWKYIGDHRLDYCVLYDEGFTRLGCVVCPYLCGRKTLEVHRRRWPKQYHAFEKAMEFIFKKGKPNGEAWREVSFEEFLSNWYQDIKLRPREKRE